jgi:aspartyl-tRNA(Asn)/glutamyl-tRNA(Gln) amidotransferase subunit A
MELHELTLCELHHKLNNQEITSSQLTEKVLNRIKKVDPRLKSFITVTEDLAMRSALSADQEISKKIESKEKIHFLTGIPYALKDVFCVHDLKTTAASHILNNYLPPYTATSVKKIEAKKGVLVGKTNTDEFTMGASTESSYFGPSHNPWHLDYSSGGSSGGSATAVASGEAIYALGTDTGGSIRQPASFCGIVGLKVTYGRVSRYGVISMASSCDTIGCLTKNVADAAVVLENIAGHDPHDSTTPQINVPDYFQGLNGDLKGLKIGIPKEYFELEGIDSEVKEKVLAAIEKMKELKAEIQEVSLPHTKYAIPVYYIIAPSEVSSNLARYDGVRYGHSTKDPKNLLEVYLKSRAEGFGKEAKRRVMIGTYVLSAGYYDAYYKQAQKVRRIIKDEFSEIFKKVDALIAPTAPTTAFKIYEKSDPLSMYLADVMTAPPSVAGVPALSVPCGFSQKDPSLPIGMQIIGPHFSEPRILKIGYAYEQATDWRSKKPTI